MKNKCVIFVCHCLKGLILTNHLLSNIDTLFDILSTLDSNQHILMVYDSFFPSRQKAMVNCLPFISRTYHIFLDVSLSNLYLLHKKNSLEK